MSLRAYFGIVGNQQHLSWIAGATVDMLLDSAASNGELAIFRTTAGYGEAVPVHVHSREDEVFVVLEGSIIVWVGDDRRVVGAGELVFLPRQIPHTYFVTSEPTTILFVVTPGGIEQAFREAGWDLSSPIPDGWGCTPEAIGEAMAKVGCQIMGPPLTAEDGPMTSH